MVEKHGQEQLPQKDKEVPTKNIKGLSNQFFALKRKAPYIYALVFSLFVGGGGYLKGKSDSERSGTINNTECVIDKELGEIRLRADKNITNISANIIETLISLENTESNKNLTTQEKDEIFINKITKLLNDTFLLVSVNNEIVINDKEITKLTATALKRVREKMKNLPPKVKERYDRLLRDIDDEDTSLQPKNKTI